MRVISIYIFREDGIPLLSRFYDLKAKKVDGLVAPFLVSATNRMEEITGAEVKGINLAEDTYLYIERFAEIICAVVVAGDETANFDLNIMARRFYKKYHKTITGKGWKGRLDGLDNFVPEMERLLGIEASMVIVKIPSEMLDTFIMTDFPKDQQEVIKAFIREEEIHYRDLVQRFTNHMVDPLLEKLVDDGYLGIKDFDDGTSAYFRQS